MTPVWVRRRRNGIHDRAKTAAAYVVQGQVKVGMIEQVKQACAYSKLHPLRDRNVFRHVHVRIEIRPSQRVAGKVSESDLAVRRYKVRSRRTEGCRGAAA